MHPGRLTHLHEGLPTTNGTRYIAVSFIDPWTLLYFSLLTFDLFFCPVLFKRRKKKTSVKQSVEENEKRHEQENSWF